MILGGFVFIGTADPTTAVGSEIAAARAAFVARGLFDPDRVTDVPGHGHVGLGRGAGDRQAAAAEAFALQPLVSVAGRAVGPFAVVLGQFFALLGGPRDRRRRFVFSGTAGLTTAVGSEVAGALGPAELLAVSSTRIVWPTSPATGM